MPKQVRKIGELNQFYDDAENAQRSLFAEQRSNLLLVAGNHYARRGTEFWRKVRNNTHINRQQKLRLTKNHIQKISKTYVNNIISHAPGVHIVPKNKSEFHDQKVAELHQSVWADMMERHNLEQFFQEMAEDYIQLGEAWCKIFFDPKKGQFITFEHEHDEEGNTTKDRNGEPIVLRKFTGDVVFERIFGFNVLTDPGARSPNESRYVIYRKMVDTKDLKAQFEDDEEKHSKIAESSNKTFQIFDGVGTGFSESKKNQTMVREYYFKPDSEYPNGYYYITADDQTVLFEGELPHGVFPICHVGFDSMSTSARSRSVIHVCRPYQAEINRTASTIAESQITSGDKLVVASGASVNPGGTSHGIKVLKTNGQVTHLPGRTGEQYLPYLQFQIDQMYLAANIAEDSEESGQQLDPFQMLFRSMKDKKKFALYAMKFERFQKEIALKALKYAKKHYSNDMVIQVFDKKERVNIPEFKSTDDLSFEIMAKPVSEDLNSMLGKQLALQNALQFGSGKLAPEDVGQMIVAMPFLNDEEILGDLKIDYENFKSDVLAMDRGQFVPAESTDNHKYYIRKLTNRMKKKDFDFLDPAIQSNYQIKLQQHQQFMQKQMQDAAAAQAGFIPSGGMLITTDVRVPKADDPSKTERAKVPIEALAWLIERLEKQGQSQALFQSLPISSQSDIGAAMAQQSQVPQGLAPTANGEVQGVG
jgi:hypothetical protein